jgi:hypothetical protein
MKQNLMPQDFEGKSFLLLQISCDQWIFTHSLYLDEAWFAHK